MSASSFLRRLIGRRDGVNGEVQKLFKLCDALMAESGEYASTALARDALAAYQGLDEHLRGEFFDVLARHYSPTPASPSRKSGRCIASERKSDVARLRSATYSPAASSAWVSSIDFGNCRAMKRCIFRDLANRR